MIILGIDGMDPRLVEKYLEEGRLPNIRRLLETGSMTRLATTTPPQSAVAWSTFATGANPGHHGVFDFIHRDPTSLFPFSSMASVRETKRRIAFRSYVVPLGSGKVEILRRGKTFWEALTEAGVAATIVRLPVNFPPVGPDATSISGMGTPDILGGYGTYTIYSDGPPGPFVDAGGGRFVPVKTRKGRVEAALRGPPHPLRQDFEEVRRPVLEVGFTAWIDPDGRGAKFRVQDSVFLLQEGEWSDWIPVRFDVIPHIVSVAGICKFYLKRCHREFRLYVTPINIDPLDPAVPISVPEDFAEELAREEGRFYTQGMAEDTSAIRNGALTDAEYLSQAQMVLEEQTSQLDYFLDRFEGGLLFYYLSSIDPNSHVFWRAIDPEHPLYTEELARNFGHVIPETYDAMDRAIGKVLDRAGPSTAVVVMSDHGFTSFRRSVSLNQWLLREGYLVLRSDSDPAAESSFVDVDWSRTTAYGLGLNGLYLNLKGREKTGIVYSGAEAKRILGAIERGLLELEDPESGGKVIRRVFRTSSVYEGDELSGAPDLIIGYEDGYRASWKTVLGGGTGQEEVISDNLEKWSGDHCIDPALVPGILISNRRILVENPVLADLAPTVLSFLGATAPGAMKGRPLLGAK
ncbi:MAG: alkaline phosphatase family protein [Planctomycetota bacterium]|nr:alkaline phosphatase family protein [Planctomycetota bacterium]